MNKETLAQAIVNANGVTKKEAKAIIETIITSTTEALAKGENVALVGFGTFSVKGREARNGRNPLTGATLHIPATNAVKFSAGKDLKEAINK